MDPGVRIRHGRHHPLDAARNDERNTRWRTFVEMAAGLQRDVESRAPSAPSRLPQGHHLSMGAASVLVMPRADDLALVHDDRAHWRIRAGVACTTPGKR